MKGNERSGLLIALAGFALFTCGDAVTKSIAGAWSPWAVAALRFTIGAVVTGAALYWREGARAFIPQNPWLQVARGLSLGMGTLGFFFAIFLMPLTVAVAISFVAPAIAALLARPLLGERVRPLTWVAVIVAFAGVLVVLRPNVMTLGWPAFLPLLTALGMSLLIITNRASAGQGSALSMQFFVAAVAACLLIVAAILGNASGIAMLHIGQPDWTVIARCFVVAGTGTIGHWMVYVGTTRAGASTIAPATYVQLLASTILGWLLFDNRPDLVTLAGAAVIISAGLLMWWDARRRVNAIRDMDVVESAV
ncbi:DMT family transporter [Altererythrobacter sp. CC-YST694]|uniref:DMT family transporter n=1 Tax=Altererythrobacter sp. CC-YST694 TaxID=2755038 RepID=UPI001D0321B2|nr:DMT family transporter [Altererythrobacter sp. CC-YST694]MCB5424835.1 DMT family transporter [Altererythrobacter sp. CC-YST694]